jgi:hypothetical protein
MTCLYATKKLVKSNNANCKTNMQLGCMAGPKTLGNNVKIKENETSKATEHDKYENTAQYLDQ